jgi:hypothetical protein
LAVRAVEALPELAASAWLRCRPTAPAPTAAAAAAAVAHRRAVVAGQGILVRIWFTVFSFDR